MKHGMDVASALNAASAALSEAGLAESRRDAASLLCFVLDRPQAWVIAHPEYMLDEEEAAAFALAVGRRVEREPLQYITGRQEFFRLDFDVEPGVLIPRPETEILVENAIERLSAVDEPTLYEIGVGTGCISISILNELRNAQGVGVDISPLALQLASRNAQKHMVADRFDLRSGSLFEPADSPFDAVVSNPPYVPDADLAGLQPEVRDYEPVEALAGGVDGLVVLRRIIAEAPRNLKRGGALIVEIGFGQAEAVDKLLADPAWADVRVDNDLQGIPRVFSATLVSE